MRFLFASIMATLLLATLTGCGGPFPESTVEAAKDQPSFGALRQDPTAYRGRLVILGGKIVQIQNRKNSTVLEIVQRPLGGDQRPLSTNQSGGRFLAVTAKFLDPSIYKRGREVTVAGRVSGVQPGTIGKRSYSYPVISISQIHLWQPESTAGADYDWAMMNWGYEPGMWGPGMGFFPGFGMPGFGMW
ncbi:Starvation-inducible outer membrane lipoprotein [Methylacidimicrobium sp. AP8]|nr:Starvation-inducible outer membrane lipoprotein [Methylacidimicrobium sp. AP8]